MALNTRVWAAADGFPQQGSAYTGAAVATEVSNAIGQLTALFGGIGTTNVANVFNWRIDRQNAPAGFVNLSVQRNGVGAPSTVASVFVPTALNIAPGPGGPAAQPHAARMSELLGAVRHGLEQSFASLAPNPGGGNVITRFEVFGTFSA